MTLKYLNHLYELHYMIEEFFPSKKPYCSQYISIIENGWRILEISRKGLSKKHEGKKWPLFDNNHEEKSASLLLKQMSDKFLRYQ